MRCLTLKTLYLQPASIMSRGYVLALTAVLFGSTVARGDFTFPDGSSGVSGTVGATVRADIEPNFAVDDYSTFGPTSSYFAQHRAPNASHAGITTYGAAAAGISATPQSIHAYATATTPDYLLYPNEGYVDVFARESALLDFSANPDLAGPSFLPLRLNFSLGGVLSATGNLINVASVAFELISGGYFDTLSYSDSQVGGGSKSISENLSVRIYAEPTENPLLYLATWEVRQQIYATAGEGSAVADFSHTTSLSSLTFANGQSLAEFGVQVTFASGGLLPPNLDGPPDLGGGTQPVPEPATLTMLCTGGISALCVVGARRRRKVR